LKKELKIHSLGYRTDLFFPAFDGIITDRGDYLVIQTPSNPDFYWGNFLLFSHPPKEDDFKSWRELFAKEMGAPPQTKHQVFGWDSSDGELGVIRPFTQAGFRMVQSVVLISQTPCPPNHLNNEVAICALQTDSDWQQAVVNQVACREAEFSESNYLQFKKPQMERYRRMEAAGKGHWYGAFIGSQLVADLGIFHQEGLGRYQSVGTHPDHRQRGIAATLVYEAGRLAIAEHKLHTLVIVAEEDSSPARIYQSAGFEVKEKEVGLEWWLGIAKEKK
jgi:ribosomal protein S18 acetylase RimI-like enzyme